MFRPHTMKRPARSLLLKKHASLVKAKKRLVVSVESVRLTPVVQERAEQLAAAARRAKEAHFLDKYRVALPS
mgnify:FL=1|jgi:hypothetical protein